MTLAVIWSISVVSGALLGLAKNRPVLGLVLGFVPVVGPFAVAVLPGREPAGSPSRGSRTEAVWGTPFPAWRPELSPPPVWPPELSPLPAWPPPPTPPTSTPPAPPTTAPPN